MTHKTLNLPIKCYFCNGNHICRNCPIEASLSPIYKNKVGNMMEYYIAENFKCPECNNNSLYVLGNHTPSLDIICKCCDKKFEVKSKCLSVQKIPKDINLNHGSYNNYIIRLSEKLNLFVIIYGVDRISKNIYIREVLYANNTLLLNTNIIEVKRNNNCSTIIIKNKNFLKKIILKQNTIINGQILYP
jgi:hypothetical protein